MPVSGWSAVYYVPPAEVITKVLEIVSRITLVAGLIFILVGGFFKWWVWFYQLKDCDDRAKARDAEWKERLTTREAELKAEIHKWEAEANRANDMLDRTLTLQEQRAMQEQRVLHEQRIREGRGTT